MSSDVWLHAARAGGIVAWLLLTLNVVWGLVHSTRIVGGRLAPAWWNDLHRFFAGLAVAFALVHVLALVVDDHYDIGPVQLVVPLSTASPPKVAWGVVVLHLLVAVEVTSLLMRHVPRRVWRAVHHLTTPAYVLATYHGIELGTDAAGATFRIACLASVHVVLALLLVRIVVGRVPARGTAPVAPARRAPPTTTAAGHARPEPST